MTAKSYERERERESERAIETERARRIKKNLIVKNTVECIQLPCFYFQRFITVDKILNLFFSTFIPLLI